MSKLVIKNVSKSFDEKQVLHQIDLQVEKNQIVSIIGPSGVGKSTLFNIIAGLLEPSSGDVLLDGRSVVNQPGNISYMLQKDLLLPYKTIEDNVALPLLLKGVKKKEAIERANKLLREFGLQEVHKSYPKELSGGMRQRIALLRTYLFSSNLILLDEPFSALDTFTKRELHEWYVRAHRELALTTLFITHDIDEAIYLSDCIYIMGGKGGKQLDYLSLDKKEKEYPNFLLSDTFLAYKKKVYQSLQGI